jgi:hypothetical protein
MLRTLTLTALLCLALVTGPDSLAASEAHPPFARPPGNSQGIEGRKIRGMCWEARGRVDASNFEPLQRLGVEWISQTPFGWQRDPDRPVIRLNTRSVLGFGAYWGESDEGISLTTRLAHQRHMRVLLKPHLWLGHGEWCGGIRMKNEADWAAWFQSYSNFIQHYAQLAEREKIEMLCVGVELKNTATRERDWRAVIAGVRQVYHGRLVYAANWDGEVDSVAFWDALDAIGVQAYYPLSTRSDPEVTDLLAGWEQWEGPLERQAARWNKPVVFTEVGYKSCPGAANQPWEWDPSGPVDLDLQSRCYEALLRACWDRPWFGGLWFWKWSPDYERAGGPANRDFTPERKPAEGVIRKWYTGRPRAGH